MTSAFSSSGEDVITRHISTGQTCRVALENLHKYYEVDRCLDWISTQGYRRVALQFPDEMMADAVTIATRLEQTITGIAFILGDTSYGSCCVDEVTAQHGDADCIIHYGRACLSRTLRLPVLYVFGHADIDTADCASKFRELFPGQDSKVILMYDTIYDYAIAEVTGILKQYYTDIAVSQLRIFCSDEKFPEDKKTAAGQDTMSRTLTSCGRTVCLPVEASLDSYNVLYIGEEGATLSNLIMTLNKCKFYSYNPSSRTARQELINVNKALMKRYYLVEKAKDAKIVGILVGTLGVVDYLSIINRLKTLLKKAGKKIYTFVVGKLNVPKLANFMEIDIFVLIACPENTLLDSSEFYRPIVTPYEMELACNPERSWTGDCITSFQDLLPGGSAYMETPEGDYQEQADVSLITGKMRRLGDTSSQDPVTSNAVMMRAEALAVTSVQAESAGEFLAARSWQGLHQNLGETPVVDAVEGQHGTASGYSHEHS